MDSFVHPKEPRPTWARQWPDLYDRELRALADAGALTQVDQGSLAQGALIIDVQWPFDGGLLPLRIMYPANYPWIRPQVVISPEHKNLPERHCSPIDGNLCLLGRDTSQWNPEWTAAKLLQRQLADAINGTGTEDPQGEPMEFWWNTIANQQGYCLIDSDFDPGDLEGGMLKIAYRLRKSSPPDIEACVIEARSLAGAVLLSVADPRGIDSRDTMTVPWVNLKETLAPDRHNATQGVENLIRSYPRLVASRAPKSRAGREVRLMAVSYPMEVGHGRRGRGWLFLHGSKEKTRGTFRGSNVSVVRTLRAGASDLLYRNPGSVPLRGKRIALFGIGSLGAPIALELAKNGCAELALVDHDIVEPGNSVRWPMGVSAWGTGKTEAIRHYVLENYPSCAVRTYTCNIGTGAFDDKIVKEAFDGAHLIVDATASVRATQWLDVLCRSAKLPLVSAHATPNLSGGLAGGVSGIFLPDSGCCRCLEWAWCEREIERPPGHDSSDRLIQPPGCSERTFEGAGYDVQEVSLQAVRMAVAALAAPEPETSMIATLGFDRGQGAFALPIWRPDRLKRHPKCGCSRGL